MGIVIGKFTGNYFYAILGSLIIDIDHTFAYIRHNLIFDPKKLLLSMFDPKDETGDQRGLFHNVFVWALITGIVYYNFDYTVSITFSLAYLSHLLLDLLDSSDYYPFYPIDYKIKGPIEYLSRYEFALSSILFLLFLGLWYYYV